MDYNNNGIVLVSYQKIEETGRNNDKLMMLKAAIYIDLVYAMIDIIYGDGG